MIKKCEQCLKEFKTYNSKHKYCSRDCVYKSRIGTTWEDLYGEKKAKEMRIFTEEHKNKIRNSLLGKQQSEEHYRKTLKTAFKKGYKWEDKFDKKTIKEMLEYFKSKKGIKRPKEIGIKISLSKLGHHVSNKTRKKISDFFKGKTYEEIMGKGKAEQKRKELKERMKGNKNPFWEHRHSKNTIKVMSSHKLGKSHEEIMGKENSDKWHKRMSGKNHPFWKGGYSIKDYKNFTNRFKNLIRKRDNQICMLCGKHREKMQTALSVHHIDYDKYNSIPENCISLCFECHALTNYDREKWIEMFHNKLSKSYKYDYLKDITFEVKGRYL